MSLFERFFPLSSLKVNLEKSEIIATGLNLKLNLIEDLIYLNTTKIHLKPWIFVFHMIKMNQ